MNDLNDQLALAQSLMPDGVKPEDDPEAWSAACARALEIVLDQPQTVTTYHPVVRPDGTIIPAGTYVIRDTRPPAKAVFSLMTPARVVDRTGTRTRERGRGQRRTARRGSAARSSDPPQSDDDPPAGLPQPASGVEAPRHTDWPDEPVSAFQAAHRAVLPLTARELDDLVDVCQIRATWMRMGRAA
jgi:hypothetical protein